ncbi:MAG TPA: cytochrome P450 [Solirubrobacterales bacterium]|nr:cytochrome P450 [Solirubrobacterales bacterium]
MSTVAERPAGAEGPAFPDLVGTAPPSPAGPIEPTELAALGKPPVVPLPRTSQMLRFSMRQIEYVFGANRRIGEVFRMRTAMPGGPVVTSHPDHVRSLFTAKPEQAPSLTGESPLRPILGTGSVLTSVGARHMRQRKLLLPPFHGEAIERYTEMISEATEREIDRWPLNKPFALAPRMQAITLDVIMAGIFGVEGKPQRGTPEHRLRTVVKQLVNASTSLVGQAGELLNIGREEAVGVIKLGVNILDRPTYAVIEARRRDEHLAERRDILSLLLQAETEEGERMNDKEVRDELLTLVLAGHETTANSLAWAWERLVRNPEAHEALREATRNGGDAEEQVEATIVESMRSRPVVPFIGRRVKVPWQLGPYGVSADTPIGMSILLVHHREDLYPDPFAFRPERWLGRKPGTYEWIPFGGGIRRCLGAALAMAEMRVVLEATARRLDLEAAEPEPERALHRNVTMIPAQGGRVVLRSRSA